MSEISDQWQLSEEESKMHVLRKRIADLQMRVQQLEEINRQLGEGGEVAKINLTSAVRELLGELECSGWCHIDCHCRACEMHLRLVNAVRRELSALEKG